MKPLTICGAVVTFTLAAFPALAQVTTSQYDNFRTGATLHEKSLTPQNINAKQFGKQGAFKVDGAVYAQPLFIPAVEIPGKGTHDVLFVATEHDSVYAFDASRPNDPPLWKVNFLDPARGTIPLSEDIVQCPFIRPEVGITSTPVIDLMTGTLYVLARTMIRHKVSKNSAARNLSRHRCQAAAQADPTARSPSILSAKTRAPRSLWPTTACI
jgi:hypothetical protein